jgi:hypothetical protein
MARKKAEYAEETTCYTTRHLPTRLHDMIRVISLMPPRKRTMERVMIEALERSLPKMEAEATQAFREHRKKQAIERQDARDAFGRAPKKGM